MVEAILFIESTSQTSMLVVGLELDTVGKVGDGFGVVIVGIGVLMNGVRFGQFGQFG